MTNTPQKVCIVGGSGFIGTKLSEALLKKGYAVTVIDMVPSRLVHEQLSFVQCDTMHSQVDPRAFEGVHAVVNLAGANIGRRWNTAYKQLIRDSRILTTQHVVEAISKTQTRPTVLVSASAVGYYGDRKEEILTEESAPGTDFLAQLCVAWEAEAQKASALGVRVVTIRTANVVGPGGLLATLRPVFMKGLGGYFGSGEQRMPWVHVADIVGIYMYAIEHECSGAYNTGAGETPTQADLFRAYARSINAFRPWHIPGFMAWILFGGFASALLGSQNTVSKKIRDAEYFHQYPALDAALDNAA
jgi:hypothetical protein